jgi:hypothetical protein
MSKKRRTNQQFIRDFMNYSENGGMSHILVLEGINRYAEQLDKLTDEEVKEMDSKGSMISMAALQRTGREWLAKSRERE